MRCPGGVPKLTSKPSRTMNGFLISGSLSILGTSTCHPLKSLPLNKLLDLLRDRDLHDNVAVKAIDTMISFFIMSSLFLLNVKRIFYITQLLIIFEE